MELKVSGKGRRYGRFGDNPNHPARVRLKMDADPGVVLPPSATTSQNMGRVRDQGGEGSCTGQMGAAVRDLLYRSQFNWEKNKSVLAADYQSSAEFVYLCNLIADGDLGQDVGSTIHQTFVTLNQKGVCLESQMPYSDKQYSIPPSDQQYVNALIYKGGAYHYIPDLHTMKACIASGYSFGGGITVYESFEGDWQSTGFMPMPDVKNEMLLGGHAQHFMDYDDTIVFPDGSQGGFRVQNSWGSGWGISLPGRTDNGTYWIPYGYAQDSTMLTDCWMIHLGSPWKVKS